MCILDMLLGFLLTIGIVLSLPFWWWLFVEPIVQCGRRLEERQKLA